jgi:hypothetical protein
MSAPPTVTAVIPIPTLDELAADPEKLESLPAEAVRALLVKHAVVGQVLLTRLLAPEPKTNRASQQLVGAAEVADMLGRGKSWVEHHLDDLPPRRSLCGQPVWLKCDVEAWMKHLPKYGAEPS